MEASSGFRGEAQREGGCLPELNQLPFMKKRGLEGYPLFNKEKIGVNQPITSDSNFSPRLASILTPRLIYMTRDLTAYACPQHTSSLAKDSHEDGVTELLRVFGE